MATPGPQMDFVHGDRLVQRIGFFTFSRERHFFRKMADQRRRFRAHLRFKSIRIGAQGDVTPAVDHFVLVQLPLAYRRDKQLPNTIFAALTHRMTAAVPEVEFTDHGNTRRVGAQSAKLTPSTLSSTCGCALSFSYGRKCVPSASSQISSSCSNVPKRYGSSINWVFSPQRTSNW